LSKYRFSRIILFRSYNTYINSSCFVFGAFFRFGWKYGNENSNKTNVTTQAARTSLPQIKSFFGGGTVMGLGLQV
jgi:hypothetical protein